MTKPIIVTGTDTGIGKTLFSAALTQALSATYWKPVQSGLEEETDTQAVTRLTGCKALPETYRLQAPASPHFSAEEEGVLIDVDNLTLPEVDGPLVVEGAGGLMVPLTRETLYVDLFKKWQAPIVLCARTGLGTINHSLLSIEALRARGCNLLGIVFIGDEVPDSERTVAQYANVKSLGRLPQLQEITPETIGTAFAENFCLEDFYAQTGEPT
ncbi:ATP-dependent dethiobiotin synthetase BioD [Pseudovibrio axinellae]|uniref:ATP-dependent dethiobiotin synthetase BioD n=1 Tax=Pseudovibrio axinellae TaxID=989403 RepID=A0A165VMM8_9HYPH|nr:dethiobiotin synthase [Pseudovibrio axinellae]KZL14542.1 ATP-dependent dethiobiotin synthetase BioD [Pseudovibrio axinellae]SER86439.1 dethiobiotin synthetase [Pseudovibrio axinellae]